MNKLLAIIFTVCFTSLAAGAISYVKAETKEFKTVNISELSSEEQEYYRSVVNQIMGNWAIPDWIYVGPEDYVKVVIKVRRDGVLVGRRIEESSGNQDMNRLAIRTIANSTPLPPMPEEMQQEHTNIRLQFDKNKNQQ